MNKYYIYAYLREDGSPYYVGKGKGQRFLSKKRLVGIPPKERITFLLDKLTEEEAFEWEKFFIAAYGRIDNGTGVLRNRTDGGEGSSGYSHTDETKDKQRKYIFTEDHKRKLREARKGKIPNPKGNPNPKGWTGPKPEEWKEKMRKPKGPQSEEHKKKISESLKKMWQNKK